MDLMIICALNGLIQSSFKNIAKGKGEELKSDLESSSHLKS